jgi:hypothetical protein
VVEFIHRDQPVVEGFDPKPVHSKAEGRMGAAENGSAKVCHGSGGIVLLRAE